MFSINDFLKNNDSKWISEDDDSFKEQYSKEIRYYLNSKNIKPNEFDKQLISNVNEKELTKLVTEKNYNYDIMKIFSRYVNLLIYLSNEEPGVRDFFKNNEKIGKESVEGIAFKSDLKNIKDMFIVKIPKKDKEGNIGDLIHEFFIGSHLNILRKEIMNFAYIYGAFDCNFPILSDHHVYNICSSHQESVNYLVEENIKDNISCEELFRKLDLKEIILISLQVFLALSYANDILEFTHYDLHLGNILIKRYPNFVIIPYPFIENGNKRYIYIKTQYIPFIIDYGFSHIKIDSFNYSLDGGVYFGDVDYELSNPLSDFFRFITSALFSVSEEEYKKGFDKILKYFIKDIDNKNIYQIKDIIVDIHKHTNSSLPGDKKNDGKEFIHFILDNFKYPEISDKNDNSARLLSCLNPDCKNEKDILNKILDVFNPVNIFYEIYNETMSENYDIKKIKEMFHSSENGYIENINQDIKIFNSLSQKYEIIKDKMTNEQEIKFHELVDKLQKIGSNLIIYDDICKIIKEEKELNKIFNTNNVIKKIEDILRKQNEIVKKLKNI